MCSPISVTTGGATGGCSGVCQIIPHLIATAGIFSILVLNFKGLLPRIFSWKLLPFYRKSA